MVSNPVPMGTEWAVTFRKPHLLAVNMHKQRRHSQGGVPCVVGRGHVLTCLQCCEKGNSILIPSQSPGIKPLCVENSACFSG